LVRLRSDPAAWTRYQDEIAVWDVTLKDGLDDEPQPLGRD
jgi:hypothetical protein